MMTALKIIFTILLLFAGYWLVMSLFGTLISLLVMAGVLGVIWLVLQAAWKNRKRDKLPEASAKAAEQAHQKAERALKEMEKRIETERLP